MLVEETHFNYATAVLLSSLASLFSYPGETLSCSVTSTSVIYFIVDIRSSQKKKMLKEYFQCDLELFDKKAKISHFEVPIFSY